MLYLQYLMRYIHNQIFISKFWCLSSKIKLFLEWHTTYYDNNTSYIVLLYTESIYIFNYLNNYNEFNDPFIYDNWSKVTISNQLWSLSIYKITLE